MPIYKTRTVFEVARGIKCFLKLDVGVTRGQVPIDSTQTESRVRELKRQLKNARTELSKTEKQLSKSREKTPRRNQRVAQPRNPRNEPDGVTYDGVVLPDRLRPTRKGRDGTDELYFASPHKYIFAPEHQFIYFVVQKVACTSVKTALLPLFGMEISDRDEAHQIFDDSSHQLNRRAFLRKLRNGAFEGYFGFAFVRNPWDRLVSCYMEKLAEGRPGFNKREFAGQTLWPGMPFTEFVEAVFRIPDEEANMHFRSQHATLVGEGGEMLPDFVGRFENLERDFAHVARKIGAPELKLPHRRRSPDRAECSYREFYDTDRRLAEMVHERYEKDVEMFEYKF